MGIGKLGLQGQCTFVDILGGVSMIVLDVGCLLEQENGKIALCEFKIGHE